MTKKFVDGAGLSHFKSKIDDNFLDKKKGGTVEKSVAFEDTISVTNSATLGTVLTNGIKIPTNKVVEGVNKVWDYQGNVVPVGKANGLATLNADGKIPLEQLGNIDTTFVEVLTDVSKLPTTNIGKHIYLVPDGTTDKNKYAEYVYTGALPINTTNVYNAAKWEKLGDFQAEVDLTGCVNRINITSSDTVVKIDGNHDGTNLSTATIPAATTIAAGVMSAADKAVLNKIAAKYPFNISGISASPNVVEIGTVSTPKISWNFANDEFHPVKSQALQSDNGYISLGATVPVGTKSYTKTGGNPYQIPDTGRKQEDKVTLTVTTTDGETKTASTVIAHVHANYCGVVSADKTSLTAAEVIALASQTNGKVIINGRSRSVAVTQNNQKLVYAYPAYFGDLRSIKDGNGFQGFSGYTKKTVDVNGATYNVYIQNTAATANGTYTFA